MKHGDLGGAVEFCVRLGALDIPPGQQASVGDCAYLMEDSERTKVGIFWAQEGSCGEDARQRLHDWNETQAS